MKIIFKRGSMLLQTLVMCVIMSMIGVMVLKWVMARYMMSARLYRTAEAKVRTEGCASQTQAYWGFNAAPTGGPCRPDGKTVNYTITSGSSGNPDKIKFTLTHD
jgi:Tfp pilus assembly protein PilX